jgi:beta-1,4-mannosyl-glycoprotein beta-1,4-N-acetylglucosaminyltransferase
MFGLAKLLRKVFRRSGPARRPLIVEACLLFNEIDLLEIRLGELWEVVDRFVVVESDRTFAGAAKPFFFEAFSSVFKRFANKITYYKFIDLVPRLRATTGARFAFEAAQRNAIGTALARCGLHDDDIVVLSDADEIPRPSLVASLPSRLARKPFCIFATSNLRGYINNTSAAALNGRPFLGPVACRWKTFRGMSAQAVRLGEGRAGHVLDRKDRRWVYLDAGGWHLSSMGGADAFWVKAQNFSHVEDPHGVLGLPADRVPIRVFTGPLSRQECAGIQQRYLGNSAAPSFSTLGFDEFRGDQDLPGYLMANKERFRRLFFFTDIVDPRTGRPIGESSAIAPKADAGNSAPKATSQAPDN